MSQHFYLMKRSVFALVSMEIAGIYLRGIPILSAFMRWMMMLPPCLIALKKQSVTGCQKPLCIELVHSNEIQTNCLGKVKPESLGCGTPFCCISTLILLPISTRKV